MVWQKGESGNTGGRPGRHTTFRAALERSIKKAQKGGTYALDAVADRLIDEAINGVNPIPAIREIADRLDGKPKQVLASDSENPLFDAIKIRIISAEKDD